MAIADSVFWQVFRGIGGGRRIAVVINAYFDESAEEDSQNGLLAVSGYALDDVGAQGLIGEWQTMLRDFNLPYFHMSECNVCKGIYGHLTCAECDACAREAIRIARLYPLHGYTFILNQTEYREILQDRGFDCDPYTFLVLTSFIHVNKWVHAHRPNERISLFFECGYKSQRRTNELLETVRQDRVGGMRSNVASHSFVCKEDSEPTQAADLVAWQVRKGFENKQNGKPIRKDAIALLEDRKILTIRYTADRLRELIPKDGRTLEEVARSFFPGV